MVVTAVTLLYPVYPHTALLAAWRILHGFFFGIATTLNMALFFDVRPEEFSRTRAMGIYAASLAGGKMVGRALGGALADLAGYGASFAAAAACTALAILATWGTVRGSGAAPAPAPADRAAPQGAAPWHARLRTQARLLRDPFLFVCVFMGLLSELSAHDV